MRKSLFFIALLSFFLLVFYYSKITSSIIFPVKPIPDDGGEVSCSSLASTQCLARSDCCWSPHWGVCFSVGEKCCHSIASGSGSFEANNCPNDALDCYVCQSGGSWADTCSGKYPECTGKTIGESCGTNKNCDSSCNCVSVTPTQTCVMTMETIPGQDWSDYAGVRLSCSLPNSVCQQGDTLAGTFGVNQMPCPTNPIIQLSITGSGCSVKDSLAVTGYIASGPGYWGGYSWTFPTIPTGCLGKTVTLTLSSEGKSTSTTIKFSTDPTRDNQPTVPGAGSWSPSTIFSNSLITYSTHAEDDKGLSKIQILFATYPPSHAPETERLSDFSVVKTCSVSGTSADCTYTTPTSYPVGYEVCMIGIATDIQGQSNPGWDMGSRIDRNCITVCNFPSDTDNGKNYDVRGTCTNACGGSYTDFCPWSAPQGYCCSALGDYWTATSIADDGTTVCCETSGHPSPVAGSPANPCLETRTINCKNILGEYYINPSTQSCDLSFYDCSSEGKVCSNGACIPTTGDVTAPTTTAVIGSGSGGYGIALDCTDNIGGTGCKKTYYCIDNNNACSPTTQYSSQISTSCSGCCYIKYYSTDNSNNIESTKSNSFGTCGACIRSNPSVTITPSSATGSVGTLQVYSINVANNDNSNCGSSTFSLSVSQCPTGWTCTLSKNSLIISAGSTDSTSISVSPNPTASSGTYTFKVTATNSGANSYSAEGSANYVIQSQNQGDVTAPTTTAVIGSGSGGYGIALDCTDNIGGTGCKKTYYCIDNNNACSPTTQYSSQISTSCSGCCYIKYYSTDNSNNIESTKSNSFGTSCTQGGVTLTCGECKVGSTCQCSMSGTCDSGALVVTSNKDLAIAAPIVQYVPPSSITYTPLKTGEINAIAICVEPTVDIKIVQVEVSGNQGSSGLLNCPASCNKNSPCSCSVNNCNSGIFIASGDPLTSAVVKDITNPFTVSFTPTNPGTINVIAGCYDQPTRTEKASITVTDTGYACIRSNPSVTITPSSATGSVGTLQVYSINVANNDNSNCGSSTFSLSVSQCPTGWTCTLSKNSLSISAGSTDSTSISVSPNPTASSGTYTFKVTATNSGANSYSAEGSANYVIQSQQNPTPTANLWVSPVNSNGGVGSTFTIDVNIKNVKDLMGYDIKLGWDPNVLSCVSSVSHSPWPSPNYFYAHDSCYTGYYWGVGTALAPIKTFSGDTSLVTLTFKVLSAGTSSFDFKNVEIANSSFQDMSYTTTSGYFNSGNPG